MIASLAGTVIQVSAESVVVEVGGVGIAVHVSPSVARTLHMGDHARLSTSLVVREDSLTLFGFFAADDRDVFETLQSVSGVGPRLALGILSALTPDQLRAAVHGGDERTLTAVPGIGKKGAQRMVLELADRLAPPLGGSSIDVRDATVIEVGAVWHAPVREALVTLGWSSREADEAIGAVSAQRKLSPEDFAFSSTSDEISKMLSLALRGMSREA